MPAALGIFAVGFADGILTARSFAGRRNQRVDVNQELLAYGAANAAAGFTQSFPVGASNSRTAANDQMGGKTQVVGLVAAAVAAVVLVFLTAPVEKLPLACLGAVIVVAAWGLVEPDDWRALAAASRREVAIAAITMAAVVAVGVLQALVMAVVLSLVDVIARSSRPHDAVLGWVPRIGRYADVSVHLSARVTPGVVVYRLDDRLFFANARYFKARAREAMAGAPTPTRWLVFDAQFVNNVDASGAEAVEQLAGQLAGSGVTFVVARLESPAQAQFDSTGLTELIGAEHFYPTVEAAVRACIAADAHTTATGYPPGTDDEESRHRAMIRSRTSPCSSVAHSRRGFASFQTRIRYRRADHLDLGRRRRAGRNRDAGGTGGADPRCRVDRVPGHRPYPAVGGPSRFAADVASFVERSAFT